MVSIIPLVIMIVVGLIAGFIVHGWMYRNSGLGLDLDVSLMVGVFGSFLGVIANITGTIKTVLGIGIGGLLGSVIWGTLGAVSFLIIANLIKRSITTVDD